MEFLYKTKVDEIYIKKYFFFGIFYYKKEIETLKENLRFLGLPIWNKRVEQGFEKFSLFSFYCYKKSSRKTLYKEILKKLDDKYEHIFVNHNCSGETYLYLSYLTPPKNSVFVATKKYHVDLCHMLHPEVDCIYLPLMGKLRSYDGVYKERFGKKTFYNILPFKHFEDFEKRVQKGEDVHYCKEICKTMHVEYSTKSKLPIITEDVKSQALEKAKKIGLRLDNFVFIAPETQSNVNPKENFWQEIIDSYLNKGVDVFLNVISLNTAYGCAKTCFLTVEEAYYIASLSKEIIGIRSGFLEILTSIPDIMITCYYTGLKHRGVLKALPAESVMRSFGLTQLPNADVTKIKEVLIKE